MDAVIPDGRKTMFFRHCFHVIISHHWKITLLQDEFRVCLAYIIAPYFSFVNREDPSAIRGLLSCMCMDHVFLLPRPHPHTKHQCGFLLPLLTVTGCSWSAFSPGTSSSTKLSVPACAMGPSRLAVSLTWAISFAEHPVLWRCSSHSKALW